MRRLAPLTLVCALICLLLAGGPAWAAPAHHHHHGQATHTTATATTHAAPSGTVASAGPATAKDGLRVLNDCSAHGQLTRDYPLPWLKKALSMMSSGTAEYSNCSTVLHQAVLRLVRPGSGGGGSGSGTTIVIVVVAVLVLLAALLAGLALRRRRGDGPPAPAA